ncbi:hypothetical protein ABL78_7116 [Leptomonas seymouri]|uniref:Uncharacterized protein n=1 Tax=Leptomonas seymouri TaxID=5684 RepID=A0A0N1I008_LEPSE|nr:hypothetical protein ABL78_7116 [Leptomonas seymouri]|eukprot:KPI83850.1 hypothetical protein ABL78_7116 [Leptomonas seymouri]
MSASDRNEEGVAKTIREECRALSTLLSANRRSLVYRHHRFFRRSRHAGMLAKRCFTGKGKASLDSKSTEKRIKSLLFLQRCIVRAVEDCTAELAANRIDTVALSLACVSVLSRIGCGVARVVVANTDDGFAAQLWPAAMVNYVVSTSTAEESLGAAIPRPAGRKEVVAKDSYGGVLNTIVRRATSKRT